VYGVGFFLGNEVTDADLNLLNFFENNIALMWEARFIDANQDNGAQ